MTKISSQTGFPPWLVFRLTNEMRRLSERPALRIDVKPERVSHHNNRFADVRRKFMRGHGPASLSILDQRPELHGLMPAFPRTKAELAACGQVWTGLARLLWSTGLWQALGGGSEVKYDRESDLLLAAGLNTFMARTNSSEHTMKFFHAGLDVARFYITFAKRISPHNRIMVELKPSPKISTAQALAMARKDLNLKGCYSRAITPVANHYPNWPYGIPWVRLLTVAADPQNPKTLHASYGAWFAQYAFTLLYRAICDEHRAASNS